MTVERTGRGDDVLVVFEAVWVEGDCIDLARASDSQGCQDTWGIVGHQGAAIKQSTDVADQVHIRTRTRDTASGSGVAYVDADLEREIARSMGPLEHQADACLTQRGQVFYSLDHPYTRVWHAEHVAKCPGERAIIDWAA